MKNNKLLPFLSLCLLFGMTNVVDVEQVNATTNTPVIFNNHHEYILDRIAYFAHEERSDYQNFFNAWYNDPTETEGINFFNNYLADVNTNGEPDESAFTSEYIKQAKNMLYFSYFIYDYAFNVRATIWEDYTCLLDHIMPLKDSLISLKRDAANDTIAPGSEDAKCLFTLAASIYQDTLTTMEDTFTWYFEPNEFSLTEFMSDFKTYVGNNFVDTNKSDGFEKVQSNYVKSLASYLDKTEEFIGQKLTNYLSLCEQTTSRNDIETFTHCSVSLSEDIGINIPGHEEEIASMIAHGAGYNALFHMLHLFEEMITPEIEIYDPAYVLLNNAGPILYKSLDLLCAIDEEDDPNIIILATQCVDDLYRLKNANDIEKLFCYENYFNERVNKVVNDYRNNNLSYLKDIDECRVLENNFNWLIDEATFLETVATPGEEAEKIASLKANFVSSLNEIKEAEEVIRNELILIIVIVSASALLMLTAAGVVLVVTKRKTIKE